MIVLIDNQFLAATRYDKFILHSSTQKTVIVTAKGLPFFDKLPIISKR